MSWAFVFESVHDVRLSLFKFLCLGHITDDIIGHLNDIFVESAYLRWQLVGHKIDVGF